MRKDMQNITLPKRLGGSNRKTMVKDEFSIKVAADA